MKTLTICGSMKFCNVMKDIVYYLETEKGYNILQCVYCPNNINSDNDELKALEKAHYKKIDLSNGICQTIKTEFNGDIRELFSVE